MNRPEPPLALLAELSHRCPLQCPYCSNPLELERGSGEIDTATWQRVLSEAAALGILQVHFSGGEPTVRRDLPDLVRHAAKVGLYSNLITSGVLTHPAQFDALVEAGLEHVQLSIQDADAANGDRIAGLAGAQAKKRAFAALVRRAGLPLTINAVVHRQNLENLERMIALAVELGAQRMEVAHVQYYGWALANRDALLPTREQLDDATAAVEAARTRLKGVLMIDYVVPDYYAHRPKSCMGGWGRRFLNVSPAGKVLPCHAAESLPGFAFPSVNEASLAEIWYNSEAFRRYRGTDWMPMPCRDCERREIDWGGCRCQAFALTGDAGRVDPACALSPDHHLLDVARRQAEAPDPALVYRRIGGAPAAPVAALGEAKGELA
ncbi:MAG TPA: pyrroloquinoline quinone biosynthesis protein PqqE [Stellaceae bacterium]|nr:pyrroloquinoline quinone biosynthesis protein PqqE [Stellaceae bacterium]